jgi:thiamine biosynthesis lipoprotein
VGPDRAKPRAAVSISDEVDTTESASSSPLGANELVANLPDSVQFRALGTTAHLLVTDPDRLDVARRILDAELVGIDAACSRFRPDSELSMVNRSAGQWCTVSALFAEALSVALSAARATDGDVDPCLGGAVVALGYDRDLAALPADGAPITAVVLQAGAWRFIECQPGRVRIPRGTALDFGATAKALAADRAAARAAAEAGCGVLVSLGGDICVSGQPPGGGWRVRVCDDHGAGPEGTGQTIAISAGGLATSSTTVRTWLRGGRSYHHIIDPATGLNPPTWWRTASVAAASCVDANSASTAAIVRGERAAEWLTELALPARLVRHDRRVVTVAGWPHGGGGE